VRMDWLTCLRIRRTRTTDRPQTEPAQSPVLLVFVNDIGDVVPSQHETAQSSHGFLATMANTFPSARTEKSRRWKSRNSFFNDSLEKMW
jgi:hypothetical protein